jgi:hypothetical protein
MKALWSVMVKWMHVVFPNEQDRIEAWLGKSVDRVDLDRRLMLLDRGRRERSWMGAGF